MTGSYYVTLTPQQAELLDALREHGPSTLKQLKDLTSVGHTYLRRAHHELQDLELLTSDFDRSTLQPMTLAITRTGSRALARHKRQIELAKLDVVPPPTFNTVGTTFTPPPCSYYRNSGNAHIASRGVGC